MAEVPKPGSIVHVEIPTKDMKKTKKFYGDVFGWKFKDVPQMNYTLFETPGAPNGGFREPFDAEENRPLNFILVDSVENTVKKIKKAGGKILRGKEEVPGQGWFAIFQDSTGSVSALWKNNPSAQPPQ